MIRRLRDSSATIVACIVILVVAAAGSASAADAINGKNIKKGSIPLSALSEKAQDNLAGETGPPGPGGQGGPTGPAGASAARYWAVVDDSGSVVHSSGGVSAEYTVDKHFEVTFPEPVSDCAAVANQGSSTPMPAAEHLKPMIAGVAPKEGGPNTVMAEFSSGGQFVAVDFNIAVFC